MLISIKTRLIAGFALFALLLTGVGAFGYYGVSTLGERIGTMSASEEQRRGTELSHVAISQLAPATPEGKSSHDDWQMF